MSHLLIYLFFVKEFKMNNQIFETLAIAKSETVNPVDLTTSQFMLWNDVQENGFVDQHDDQRKTANLFGLLTISGIDYIVPVTEASKYGFSKLELVNGRPVLVRGSIGGKFSTTDGFQGMSAEDNLKIIIPTKTYAF